MRVYTINIVPDLTYNSQESPCQFVLIDSERNTADAMPTRMELSML